jgi:hypothetical protein
MHDLYRMTALVVVVPECQVDNYDIFILFE